MGASSSGAQCCSSHQELCCRRGAAKGSEFVPDRSMFPYLYPEDHTSDFQSVDTDKMCNLESACAPAENTEEPAGESNAGKANALDLEEEYEDGSSFKGQLVDGMRQGTGVWTSPTEQYSGQWHQDQRHGEGSQTWQDGRIYEGQFYEGRFSGQGKMEWHISHGLMVYEGQYINDQKHGHGKYIWPDGRVYDGQWVQGTAPEKQLTPINRVSKEKASGRMIKWNPDSIVTINLEGDVPVTS